MKRKKKALVIMLTSGLVLVWTNPCAAMAAPTETAETNADSTSDTDGEWETADSGADENALEALETLSKMAGIEAYEKTVSIEDNLCEEIGSTKKQAVLARENRAYADALLKKYGYADDDGNGVYKTRYIYSRIFVIGEVSDADAVLTAADSGITALQYDTPEEAALAAAALEGAGYRVIADADCDVTLYDGGTELTAYDDAELTVTTASTESDMMNLTCNADLGTEDVTVAVIDTGANTEYLDRCLTGYNAIKGTEDVTDNNGHGTMTSSVILRNTGDTVSVLPIKIMDGDGSINVLTVTNALIYARTAGADVVNLSIGITTDYGGDLWTMWGAYIDELIESGASVVCAAGNDAEEIDGTFPANYDSCWTITAISKYYVSSDFTNYGSEACEVDFCALGQLVSVTTSSGSSGTASGTSFSSPLVAACAAQLTSMGCGTDEDRYDYILEHCTDLGDEGYDIYYGNGLPVMAHAYTELTSEETEPTCIEEGYGIYTCACGETISMTISATGHVQAETPEVTADENGETWSYYCTVCGELLETEYYAYETEEETDETDTEAYTVITKSTPASKVSLTNATESQATKTLKKVSTDGDLKDSAYSLLQAKISKATKTKVKVQWKKVSGAKKYVVYGNKCGTSNKYKKLKTLSGTSATFSKIAGKKVKKGTYYKFIVVALDSDGKVIATSKTVHAVTKGGKKTNEKSIRITNGSKATVKKGKTLKIKTKVTKLEFSKKLSKHRNICYESSNKSIATVTSKGKIKAKKKGTCTIYAYAQNGVSAKIKITVK